MPIQEVVETSRELYDIVQRYTIVYSTSPSTRAKHLSGCAPSNLKSLAQAQAR